MNSFQSYRHTRSVSEVVAGCSILAEQLSACHEGRGSMKLDERVKVTVMGEQGLL
jgi:hypothetical protein